VHAGMVGLDGAKMSKSRGNLVFVSQLLAEGAEPAALRLALLGHHYREDWDWSGLDLAAAERRLGLWRHGVRRPAGPAGLDVLTDVRRRLADDLDAPAALAAVDCWAEADGNDRSAPGLVADLADALLGVRL